MYDITLTGSLIDAGNTLDDAITKAKALSLSFAGRLIRVHNVDGVSVAAEFRNGVQEEIYAL